MSERRSIREYVAERAKSGNEAQRKKIKLNGAIAQLGERLPCTQEVCGSIPHSSTTSSQEAVPIIHCNVDFRNLLF